MIVKKVPNSKTKHKTGSIRDLADYIREPHNQNPDEKVLYANGRGFLCDGHAAQREEMVALAAESVRSKNPVNHYIMSWREGEQPSPEQVEEAVSIFMEELGWKDHQAIYGLHKDTDNIHLHIAINRVHPEKLKIVEINRGFDIEMAHKAIARIEHAQGWQREQNGRYQVLENGELGRAPYDPEKPRQPDQKKRDMENRTGEKSAHRIAIEDGAAKTGKMFVESVVPESGIITLRAYSVPQSAKDTRSKSWEKVKFLQLAQEIAGRHGLTLDTYGITDQTYDYVEQNNLADFAFFQNRCTLEGAAFLVYDGKLVVYDEAYMESQQPIDTITITPANDFEYRDEGANAYGSAEAVNGGLTGTFAAPSGGDKVLRRILPFRMTDQSEADRFAKGLLRDANKNATVGTLWTGSLLRDYAAGSVVTLATEGVKSWDGTAFISRIRHDYVKTRSKLYLRKPLEGY